MDTAKVFKNGSSQAVRLPKACQFNTNAVLAHKIGDVVLLFSPETAWEGLAKSLEYFTDDYMSSRDQPAAHQQRNTL